MAAAEIKAARLAIQTANPRLEHGNQFAVAECVIANSTTLRFESGNIPGIKFYPVIATVWGFIRLHIQFCYPAFANHRWQ
jgi:hypothetical protein